MQNKFCFSSLFYCNMCLFLCSLIAIESAVILVVVVFTWVAVELYIEHMKNKTNKSTNFRDSAVEYLHLMESANLK